MTVAVTVVVLTLVSTIIALIFLILRCYSRFVILHKGGSDDYVCIVAFLGSASLAVLLILQSQNGMGLTYSDINLPTLERFLALFWASLFAYTIGEVGVKCSALLQYLRFVSRGTMQWTCWFMLGLNLAFGLVAIFAEMFQCRPIRFFWNKTIRNGSCVDFTNFAYATAAVHVVTDIGVLGIPIYLFKDMNLPRREKIALILVFMLGGIGCILGAVRIYALYYLLRPPINILRQSIFLSLVFMLEVNLGIIGICMPPLKPVVQRIMPRLLSKQKPNITSHYNGDMHIRQPAQRDVSSRFEPSNDAGQSHRYHHSSEGSGGPKTLSESTTISTSPSIEMYGYAKESV